LSTEILLQIQQTSTEKNCTDIDKTTITFRSS